jgi:predicted nuclease of predicted toxin-antitoxin system
VKFLIDAQFPKRLSRLLQAAGYDAVHTCDLPLQNATPDEAINKLSVQEQRILISKDADFYNSFLLRQQPYKLLQVTTGNITNQELEALFIANLPQLIELFQQHSLIELSRNEITVHQ